MLGLRRDLKRTLRQLLVQFLDKKLGKEVLPAKNAKGHEKKKGIFNIFSCFFLRIKLRKLIESL